MATKKSILFNEAANGSRRKHGSEDVICMSLCEIVRGQEADDVDSIIRNVCINGQRYVEFRMNTKEFDDASIKRTVLRALYRYTNFIAVKISTVINREQGTFFYGGRNNTNSSSGLVLFSYGAEDEIFFASPESFALPVRSQFWTSGAGGNARTCRGKAFVPGARPASGASACLPAAPLSRISLLRKSARE